MLGFKRFFNARRVLAGIELVNKIIKGQFGLPESFGTVESRSGAVTPKVPRFQIPLIKPGVPISGTRLSDKGVT
jgi:hypothetical protein